MIIFDLDGTLADCEHRRHFVQDPDLWQVNDGPINPMSFNVNCDKWRKFKPDWKSFYEACDQDAPIKPSLECFRHFYETSKVLIWSARCSSVKQKTIDWLEKHLHMELCNYFVKYGLKMRPIGDSTPDEVLKERWLDEAIERGNTIDFVFDDRPKVIRMWRRRGIFVFNCCQHDKEF